MTDKQLIKKLIKDLPKWRKLALVNNRAKEVVRQMKKLERDLTFIGMSARFPDDSEYIYAGWTFPIKGVYSMHSGRYGVYRAESCHLILDISSFVMEGRDTYQTTVIYEDNLFIF